MALPEVGTLAPTFSLLNQNGDEVCLSDYLGKKVLIWFFPRAFGGGWTKQIQGFRDRIQEYALKNTELLGVTFSTPEDLKKWSAETGYPGVLLSDADRSVAITYGAASSPDQEKATRISILVDTDGVIRKTFQVEDASGHPGAVLADI